MFSKMVILIPVYNPRERIINYVKKLKEKNYDEQKVFKVNLPQEAVSQIISWNLKKEVTVLLENDLPDNYNL